ncbi:MAG: type III pantothenate kinase [candidate division Zixibacteria bacterium]|nr:type III pantothenate kinase [candidate division Zixibacteria bacterium]
MKKFVIFPPMLIAIDIGNTNIKIGLFNKSALKDTLRLATRRDMTADELGIPITDWLSRMKVANEQIESAILCSVVPSVTEQAVEMCQRYLGCIPTIVSSELKLPIKIAVDNPAQLGADRIANAVAGFTKFGGPVIVVDFGTATKFEVVDQAGVYLGGVICPGVETSMAELAKRAAKLFEIKIEPPAKVIGKNTVEALKSGAFYGTIGQVDFILDKIFAETGWGKATIVATGGLVTGIEQYSRHIKLIEPNLTLSGLCEISRAV